MNRSAEVHVGQTPKGLSHCPDSDESFVACEVYGRGEINLKSMNQCYSTGHTIYADATNGELKMQQEQHGT